LILVFNFSEIEKCYDINVGINKELHHLREGLYVRECVFFLKPARPEHISDEREYLIPPQKQDDEIGSRALFFMRFVHRYGLIIHTGNSIPPKTKNLIDLRLISNTTLARENERKKLRTVIISVSQYSVRYT